MSNVGGEIVQSGIGDTAIHLAGDLNNTAGRIATNSQTLVLAAQTLSNTNGRIEHAGTGTLAIHAGVLNDERGQITSNGTLQLTAGSFNHDGASTVASQVSISASSLSNRGGEIIQTGTQAARINAMGALDNTGGKIASNGDTTLRAQSLLNQSGSVQTTGAANLEVTATAALDNSAGGHIAAGGNASLNTGSLNNNQGQMTAGGGLGASAGAAMINVQGLIAANGAVDLVAADLDNTQGTVASVQNGLSVTTRGATVNDSGTLQAAQDVTLATTGLSNTQAAGATQGGSITGRNLDIDTHAQALNNHLGTLAASGSATLRSGALNNDGGLIQTAGVLAIDTSGATLANTNAANHASGAGGITSQGSLTLATGDLNNAAGFLGARGALSATTANVSNSGGGQVVGESSIAISSTGFDNRGGQVQALGDVSLQAGAGSIDNSASLIRSAGTTTLSAGAVHNSNTGGANQGIEGNDVAITAAAIANDHGAIRADNNAALTSSGSLNNSVGLISAGNALAVRDSAAAKTLAIGNTGGTVIAGQGASVDAASLTGDGKVLSRGDLTLALTSDFNNSGEVTANHNASISTTGTLANSGKLQAGYTLAVAASNIDNAVTGEITGATTQLTATNTLTNRGLIDGQDTQINAGTAGGPSGSVNNLGTGHIYGDHLSIAAGSVNNDVEGGSAATIAARQRLDIGAGTLNNREGTLIFSAGDMAIGGSLDANRFATGQAAAVNNASATIEALGNLAINAAQINNTNNHFSSQLVVDSTLGKTDYYTSQGYVLSDDVAWGTKILPSDSPWGPFVPASAVGRERLVLKTDLYANPVYKTFYEGPSAYVAAYAVTSSHGDGGDTTDYYPTSFRYTKDDPIWDYFNVARPTGASPAGERPTQHYVDCGDAQCLATPTPEQVAAWDQAAAPWQALQARLDTFKSSVDSRALGYDVYRNYSETGYTAQVLGSQPGSILSGANMTINASQGLTNDKSHIIAGGALDIPGQAVNNVAAQVSASRERQGSTHSWGVVGQDCEFLLGCSDIYGWRTSAYSQSIPQLITLPVSQVQALSSPTANGYGSNTSLAQAHTGSTSAAISAAGTVNASVRSAALIQLNASVDSVAHISGGIPVVRTAPVNPNVPNTSLFHVNLSPSSHYLVETDPRFASYRQWLSSDYMLQALNIDPTATQKRLGDGFYEQRLVREQVAQLTGQRFLADYSSDEEQYKALMQAGATYAHQWNLRPGVALTGEQMAQLTSDIVWLVEQPVTLPDGTVTTALVPQIYVRMRDGDLDGSGTLLAGKEVNIDLTRDLINSGTIAGRQVVSLAAENVHNLMGRIQGDAVSVSARTDLNNIGGTIQAASALSATAGRDLNIQSTTTSASDRAGAGQYSYSGIDRVAALYVSNPGGTLVASAGRDANIIAGVIHNAGSNSQTLIAAGRDLNLKTLATADQSDVNWDARNYARFGHASEVGSQINAGGNLALSAGHDLNARAAGVQAAGALSASAAHDVNIAAGTASQNVATGSYAEGGGFLASASTELRQSSSSTGAVSTNFGSGTIAVVAGHDLAVAGSSVVSDWGTTLLARNNISIEAAQNTQSSSNFQESKSSGLSLGEASFSYGSQQQSLDQKSSGTSHTGSTVGSVAGDVNIIAGNQYSQSGSDVVAPTGDINVLAENIAITEVHDTQATQTEQKFRQSGLTLAVSSPVLSAVQTVSSVAVAAGQTGDGRMKALAGVSGALAVNDAANAVARSPNQAGGMNLSISLGSSKSQSNSSNTSSAAQGSTIAAGGNINLSATGAGQDSNLLIQGSDVRAGRNVNLSADNQIDLLAAQNSSEQHSTNSSSSSSIGVSFGTSGFGVNASASKRRGNSDGSDVAWTNTHVEAGNTLSIQSGGDTTLRGAAASGRQVSANVGGNLAIESLQDSSTYASKEQSIGGSITVGAGVSGSVSYNKSKIDSDFASVGEQSSIRAGDGGFDINVKGNTDLKGGAITSTQKAIDDNQDNFSTGGTLTTSDIQNQASYSARSAGVSIGTGVSLDGKLAPQGTSAGIGKDSGNASSTTQAAISGIAGNKDARTGGAESGIQKIFDADKVQKDINAQVQITQTFGLQAGKAVNDYAQGQRRGLQEQLKNADTETDKQAIQAQINDVNLQERVMNVLVGAVTGFGGSALTKESLSAAADQMRQLMIEDSKKFPGVTDGTTVLSNVSGPSAGVRGDGLKIGGTRVDLDLLCGVANERCVIQKNADGTPIVDAQGKTQLKLNEQGQVVFDPSGANGASLAAYLQSPEGQKMVGPTGGIQGAQGTLFGVPYATGSWQDRLVEAFSGTHDLIGGKLSSLYDGQGNATRGRGNLTQKTQDTWSATGAIVVSSPFAMAEFFSPEMWKVISIFLGAAR